jgi:hypothetical protein
LWKLFWGCGDGFNENDVTGFCVFGLRWQESSWVLFPFIPPRGLNSGLHTWKAGPWPLEPLLQSILLWLFWVWGLPNCFPGLA